jgi:hypothetical protein
MKRLAILVIFILLISGSVHAIGVAQEYLKDNILQMAPGTTRIFTITLQNSDNSSLNVKLSLNSKIASIIQYQEIYTIPPMFYDLYIRLNITVPADAKIGEIYPVDYFVQPLVLADGAMIPINLRINKHFSVLAANQSQEEQQSPTPTIEIGNTPAVSKIEEKPIVAQENIVSQKNAPKSIKNDYFTGALILAILALTIIFLWKKSSLLSKKLIKRSRKRRRKR